MISALLLLAQPGPSTCLEERAAIAEMAEVIERKYVLADTASRSAETIRTSLTAGQFDHRCDDPAAFADYITDQLRAILKDGHMFVEYAPDSGEAGEGDWLEEWRKGAAAKASGVRRVERLRGNIAYLHLTDFFEYDTAKPALTAAFNLVSSSNALILDLRGNPGGSPETEWPVQWTFMAPGAAIPLRSENRSGPLPDRTEPKLDWARYGSERPLVILIDKTTFSAPEAVAYSLQAQGRAVIVGSASGGGAHMIGDGIALTGGWKIGIPETRPFSPHTGSNWEGTGVQPDIKASKETAIAVALEWIGEKLARKRAASEPETAP